MKFIMNENIPKTVIIRLRELGHDVLSVKESMRAQNDTLILERAQQDERIIVTQDKDFGELAFKRKLASRCGIILFQLSGKNRDQDIHQIIQTIESRSDWFGNFSVVKDFCIRMRPIN